jgi:hypothetical protein
MRVMICGQLLAKVGENGRKIVVSDACQGSLTKLNHSPGDVNPLLNLCQVSIHELVYLS